jgi:ribosomal protein L11 methyltransferase
VADGAYPTVSLRTVDGAEDDLAAILQRFAVLGAVHENGGGGTSTVTVFLDVGAAGQVSDLVAALAEVALDTPSVSRLASEDWLQKYRASARPFPVGDTWWIDPDPRSPSRPPEGRRRIALEPRFAFGSGSHETTQLLLLHLETLDLSGASVLDAGTGSGILAFASRHRGAEWVVAFDIDPDAVVIAGTTSRDQEVVAPALFAGPIQALGDRARFDLILCNMIATEFLPLAPGLRRLLGGGGRILFSGVLGHQASQVIRDLREAGLECAPGLSAGEWISLEGVVHGP